ncbi:ATP-binding protein, partial [bacterium]|nr:ATP-binding protein [bacterium]
AEWLRGCHEIYQQIYPQNTFLLLPDNLPRAIVSVSPELLQQAMDKLVDNAVSFASDRIIMLQMRVEHSMTPSVVTLSVGNHGPKISESDAVHWFNPLVSHRQTSSSELHMGLGLYMVRLIAQSAGGKTVARNQSGWVVFGLSLPLT